MASNRASDGLLMTTSRVRGAHRFEDSPYRVLQLALAPERADLYARIDRRCQAMIEAGLLQEVRELIAAGYGPELRPMRAIGYRHVVPVALGRDTLANALEAMRRDTRHFARRQITWLRRVPDAVWLDPSHPANRGRSCARGTLWPDRARLLAEDAPGDKLRANLGSTAATS